MDAAPHQPGDSQASKTSGRSSARTTPHANPTPDVDSLRAQIERLTREREGLLDQQRQVMELIGAASPQHILHDLRNLLNEKALLQALADRQA
ncbi:MAG: hypothetical protein ACREIT_00595 [Tepidisphaeraceae bacterium]